jgi:hypothetical protein
MFEGSDERCPSSLKRRETKRNIEEVIGKENSRFARMASKRRRGHTYVFGRVLLNDETE